MKHPEGHGLPDSAALAERDVMRGAEKDLGHGITDEAAIAEGQFMRRAEHEEAEHEAAAKRGLSDDAAVWEHDLIHGAESKLHRGHSPGKKIKEVLKRLVPNKHE